MNGKGVYYSDYLQLNKILQAQEPESNKNGNAAAHDEMLFIIIHQAYELWFKQILFEVSSVMDIMGQPKIADNSPDLYKVHHRLNRVNTIMRVLIEKVDILETMTPLDFLDFRDLLRPASGFQSMQFKILEAHLGLRMEHRHGKEYYVSQLKPEDVSIIKELENKRPLTDLINEWLERMPFMNMQLADFQPDSFWKNYREVYHSGLVSGETNNLQRFDQLFLPESEKTSVLSYKARRAALFIMLYRDYPLLRLPYQIIEALLTLDEGLATWRFRHMNMVHRMIGTRVGTGGSSGKDYLKGALDKHYIFGEFAELTTFMVQRTLLPKLPVRMLEQMGYPE